MTPEITLPPAAWGEYVRRGRHRDHRHIRGDCFFAPEGAISITRCTVCGGRDEALVLTHYDEAAINAVIKWQGDTWALDHADCHANPKQFTFPRDAEDIAEAMIERLRRSAAEGRDLLGIISVVMHDRQVLAIDLEEGMALNPNLAARPTTLVAGQCYGIRREVAEKGLDPVATVAGFTGYARPPGSNEPYTRAVMVAITTPTAGKIGFAPITPSQEGPGVLGPMKWHPLGDELPLVDGLLALPFVAAQIAN